MLKTTACELSGKQGNGKLFSRLPMQVL